MRHYFISEAIKSPALSMYEITQVAGTSAAMIEATYGHKMGDLGNRWRAALDASDQTWASIGHRALKPSTRGEVETPC